MLLNRDLSGTAAILLLFASQISSWSQPAPVQPHSTRTIPTLLALRTRLLSHKLCCKALRRHGFILLCLINFLMTVPLHAEKEVIGLNSGWSFRQVTPNTPLPQWLPAKVPGDVHTALLENHLIPDPFHRDNEAKLQWIEHANWEYKDSFVVLAATLAHEHVELVFKGLDTKALVSVNGKPALTADNAFREWRIDAKQLLKPGDNEIHIVFPSGTAPPGPKPYIRRPAYEYGWDWGPRFVLSGLNGPVQLEVWDEARVADLYVSQQQVSAPVAHLNVEADILATSDGSAEIALHYGRPGSSELQRQMVTLHTGLNRINMPVEIKKPDLWFPAGYGAQPIYTFTLDVRAAARLQDSRSVHAGLRSVVLRRDVDTWGRSFELIVNGIPIFAKGANVIPFDSFPSRVTTAKYRYILESAVKANMNMVRQWGGGYYETDEFYDICDELGLMVWQDMMFANNWQPGDYAMKENVAAEVDYQIRRLRNHPSVVLLCGNNELEPVFHGDHDQVAGIKVDRPALQYYLTTFSGIIGAAAARLEPEVPFWPSSPSADYEPTSDSYRSGDTHDWTVWHGQQPFSAYEQHFPRFLTEYGFQSFPLIESVRLFTEAGDRTGITTPIMLAHQKNDSGNALIREYMLRDYSEPKNFESFLYVSQILQAEGIKIGAEHLRRNRSRTMGSIYWQLNDCWPVASWSSIDSYGQWKALQYYARRFYSPVLVSPHLDAGILQVAVVSDKTTDIKADLRVRVMTLAGKVVSETTKQIDVPKLSSGVFEEVSMQSLQASTLDLAKVFVVADLTQDGTLLSRNLLYLVPTKNITLPTVHLMSTLSAAAPGRFKLHISSDVLARSVWIRLPPNDAELSDNFFDILPGQGVDVTIQSTRTLDQLRKELQLMSLSDAFATPASK